MSAYVSTILTALVPLLTPDMRAEGDKYLKADDQLSLYEAAGFPTLPHATAPYPTLPYPTLPYPPLPATTLLSRPIPPHPNLHSTSS